MVQVSLDEICPRCEQLWTARNPNYLPPSDGQQSPGDPDGNMPHPECRHLHREHGRYRRPQNPLAQFLNAGWGRPIKALRWSSTAGADRGAYSCDAIMDHPHAVVTYQPLIGSGVDLDPHRTRLKACMEAIERFTVFMAPRCALHWGTASQLRDCVGIESSAHGDTPGWWCETNHLQSGSMRLLLLEWVQWSDLCYTGLRSVEGLAVVTDSTGYAVHSDAGQAVVGGLTECIERAGMASLWRDGLRFAWRRGSYPSRADVTVRACESLGYWCVAAGCELKQGGHACIAFLRRINESVDGPALVCGAGGGLDPRRALTHAVTEAHGMLQHAQDIWPREADPALSTVYEHFLFYLRSDHAEWLWQSLRLSYLPEIDCPMAKGVNPDPLGAAQQFGEDIFVVDRGNRLTDYLGLHAVQVIVPGLERLDRKRPGPEGLPFPVV